MATHSELRPSSDVDHVDHVDHVDISHERGKTHGDYSKQAFRCQEIKKVFAQGGNWGDLTVVQIDALEMIAVKISRILEGDPNEPDHWVDIAGYSNLVPKHTIKKGLIVMGHTRKSCSRCGKVKVLSEFGFDKRFKLGVRPECRECAAPERRKRSAAQWRDPAGKAKRQKWFKDYVNSSTGAVAMLEVCPPQEKLK